MLPFQLEIKHWINIAFVTTLFVTIIYFIYPPQPLETHVDTQVEVIKPVKQYSVCDKVDIPWLAGDRIYWNGWEDKAMFMKQDGTFTKGNVYIQQGEQVCIVVLLGPTPAYSPKLDNFHLGTKDSITIFAKGNMTNQAIQLQQHKTQSNAYYAPVHFHHQDTLELVAIDEYRSYFWETPILHTYNPYHFTSQNKLIVRNTLNHQINPTPLPTCLPHMDLTGAWVNPSVLRQASLFAMYGSSNKEVIQNGKVFVPNACQLQYTSEGQGLHCLDKKTIHIWGDNNIRRNLKALSFNGAQWCHEEDAECQCNDDNEDTSLYPWLESPYHPLILDNGWSASVTMYYQKIDASLDRLSLAEQMIQFVSNATVKKADYVILGIGNADIRGLQVSPQQFKTSLARTLDQVREVYPTQPVILRTPQYFCCGVIPTTSWNAGRSATFTSIVRDVFSKYKNMMLWDVYLLGTDETRCPETAYTKRNVISVENQFLWNLTCSK